MDFTPVFWMCATMWVGVNVFAIVRAIFWGVPSESKG